MKRNWELKILSYVCGEESTHWCSLKIFRTRLNTASALNLGFAPRSEAWVWVLKCNLLYANLFVGCVEGKKQIFEESSGQVPTLNLQYSDDVFIYRCCLLGWKSQDVFWWLLLHISHSIREVLHSTVQAKVWGMGHLYAKRFAYKRNVRNVRRFFSEMYYPRAARLLSG